MIKRTKYLFSIFTILSCFQFSFAQIPKDPDHFLIPNKKSLPTIFLVGTFHFEYYNVDGYKVGEDKQVEILSEQKQNELKELIDYISIFKPTKICIEAKKESKILDNYRLYKSGKKQLAKDEVEQIGFRLMERFDIVTIYSVDAKAVSQELLESKDSAIIKPYFDKIFKNYNFKPNESYIKLFNHDTKLSTELSLLDYFMYLNSPKRLTRDYGAYLLGDFKNGEYNGADALATYWYDRNLRIFRNIQNITTSPNDRILVLFGSGHVAILDQLLRATPEYNYIKFGELKK